jgi:hypothetical protein
MDRLWLFVAAAVPLGFSLLSIRAEVAPLSPEEVNLRVGTQFFDGIYSLGTNHPLVDAAQHIRQMGSDIIKFRLSPQSAVRCPDVKDLTELARREPGIREVLSMPFRHVLVWAYRFPRGRETAWVDGFSDEEAAEEYRQLHDLAVYLLTNFNDTGKTFYLGHWEGDWHLLPRTANGYNVRTNPPPVRIEGMRRWLQVRQQAVDDARRSVPHRRVDVRAYAEVNRVRDAMLNPADSNQRAINAVVPFVEQLDFVSWSAYDGQNLAGSELHKTLDFIEAHLPKAKSVELPGRRVFIGEFGFGGRLDPVQQLEPTRRFVADTLGWGCRFVLFWQLVTNEPDRYYSLILRDGFITPCYELFARYYVEARGAVRQFWKVHGRPPNDQEFAEIAVPILQRLPAP